MNGPKPRPSNMSEICRLCLAEDDITLPIFGEDDSSTQSQIPLSFRIMACVSVEVSLNDGLPTVICEKCLQHVNSWHEFKQICDSSQATLKEWQNSTRECMITVDKDIVIKQEPLDEEPEEEVLEITEQAGCNPFMIDDIKQEVDMYDEDRQDCLSVEAVDEETGDPLGLAVACTSVRSLAKDVHDTDVEVLPQTAGDVCHLRISDIKTECGDVIPVGNVPAEPTEGRLLRSVLQGKAKVYPKNAPSDLDETFEDGQSVKPFSCLICDKSFAYNYLLKRHEKTHTGDRNVCAYCQKGFSSHASLVEHVRLYTGTSSKPYSCGHCQQEFQCRTQYLSHIDGSDGSGCSISLNKDALEEEELREILCQCDMCYAKFPSQMLLRLHMRKEHMHYSCHKCNKFYTNGVALSNHLRSHSVGGIRHYCELCSRTFATFDLLKKHEKKNHGKEAAAVTAISTEVAKPPEDYSQVDREMLQREAEMQLERPIKEEPPDSLEVVQDGPQQPTENVDFLQSHVCHLCNEHFSSLASLRFHLKGVHAHFQCHRCPKVYTSGVALSNHLRSHSLNSLKKHKKAHIDPDGALSSSRKVANTSYKFNEMEENGLEIPEVNVIISEDDSQMIPLAKRTCSICSFIAASPSALERHMACHSKAKMYTCSICHVSMSYASSLQKHYRLIHGENVELKSIQKDPTAISEDTGNANLDSFDPPVRQPGSTRSGRRIIFNKTFKMTAQLQQARLPTPYECKICHRSFAYRSFLIKHSKIHGDPKSAVSCPVCLKSFPDAKTLNNHKGVHTRFKHYSCNVCGKSFNGLNAWQKHQRMHQKGFIYSCKLCGKRFLSKAELHEHKKMHIKVKIYTCAVCKNSYHSSSALGKHKRRHGHWFTSLEGSDMSEVEVVTTYNTPVSRTVSKATISKNSVLRTSVLRSPILRTVPKTGTKTPVLRAISQFSTGKKRPYCSLCNKTFSHMSALRKHKGLHERSSVKLGILTSPNPIENKPVTNENLCLTCNREFPDHTSLVRHKGWHTRRHNNIQTPTSSTAAGASENVLVNPSHVKVEPTTVNAFQCSICRKTFPTSSELEVHVKSHTEATRNGGAAEKSNNPGGEANPILTSSRRLACKICKKPFESKKALITHIGWHSRVSHINKPFFNTYKPKPVPTVSIAEKFTCSVCYKMFSSAAVLSKHKKLHTRKLMSSIKVKTGMLSEPAKNGTHFSCPVCHRAFKLEKYLELHIRLHTGEKRFKCNLCPQAYHRSGSLWKHKRTHHAFKLFSCPICQKRFGLKIQLTKHMAAHGSPNNATNSADAIFQCSMCNKSFSKLEKLRQHERNHPL